MCRLKSDTVPDLEQVLETNQCNVRMSVFRTGKRQCHSRVLRLIGYKRTNLGSTYLYLWLVPIRMHLSTNDLCDLPFSTTLYTEDLISNVGWWTHCGYATLQTDTKF